MRLQQDLARAAAEAEGLRAALVEEKVRSNAERTKLENLLSERFGEIATLTKLVVQIETGRSGLDGHSETKARSWIAPAFRSVWARIQAARLKRSGQFDAAYYLSTNPDVAKAGMDPALHYVVWGAKEGRRPNSGVASDDAQAMR